MNFCRLISTIAIVIPFLLPATTLAGSSTKRTDGYNLLCPDGKWKHQDYKNNHRHKCKGSTSDVQDQYGAQSYECNSACRKDNMY